jgi:hypothetical protein
MFEMIICVAVAWGGACQERPPVAYPNRVFCERAIPAAKAANPKAVALYCRPKS